MSNSNIDNLMLKFAMSRFKAGAVVTPAQQSAYELAAQNATKVPYSAADVAAGYAPPYLSNSPISMNPDGSFNARSNMDRGDWSGINPLSPAFYDPIGLGNTGGGFGASVLAPAAAAGIAGYGASKYMGNRPFANYVGKDPASMPIPLQQELLARSIQNGATDVSATRTGGEVVKLPGSSPRAMSQEGVPAVAPVKDKKGRIVTPAVPAIPAKIPAVLPSGKPAPATLTQTLAPGMRPGSKPSQATTPLRLPPTRPQLAAPVIAGGIPSPVVGSAGSNMFTRNPVRTGLGAAAIAGAAGLAGQYLTAPDGAPNRSIPFAPAAPAKTQEIQLPAR